MDDDDLPNLRIRKRNDDIVIKTSIDAVALAKDATPHAIRTLVEIALSGASESARVAAANALLDRGHGKPGQSVTVYNGAAARRDALDVVDAEYTIG